MDFLREFDARTKEMLQEHAPELCKKAADKAKEALLDSSAPVSATWSRFMVRKYDCGFGSKFASSWATYLSSLGSCKEYTVGLYVDREAAQADLRRVMLPLVEGPRTFKNGSFQKQLCQALSQGDWPKAITFNMERSMAGADLLAPFLPNLSTADAGPYNAIQSFFANTCVLANQSVCLLWTGQVLSIFIWHHTPGAGYPLSLRPAKCFKVPAAKSLMAALWAHCLHPACHIFHLRKSAIERAACLLLEVTPRQLQEEGII